MPTVADDDTTPHTTTPLGDPTRSPEQTTYLHKDGQLGHSPSSHTGKCRPTPTLHTTKQGLKTTTYLAQPYQTNHNAARDNGYPKRKPH